MRTDFNSTCFVKPKPEAHLNLNLFLFLNLFLNFHETFPYFATHQSFNGMYRHEQVSFILYWFYQFYKLLVRISFPAYFGKVVIVNKEKLHLDGPCLLVSNHPNTMIDPLFVASRSGRVMFFLANASLYKHPFTNWFFSTFYCIPIERPQDTGGKPLNNDASFARCNEFLTKGGCLYIAPEGSSYMERRLRDVKSGTARIGFSAEQANDFKLGLKIMPFGLTYSQPHRFGCDVVIHVGDPIPVAGFQDAYQQDAAEAIRDLTDHMEQQIRSLMVDIPKDIEEKTIRQLELMQQNEYDGEVLTSYFRSRDLVSRLSQLKSQNEDNFLKLFEQVTEYFDKTHDEGIKDVDIKMSQKSNYYTIFKYIFWQIIEFPIFVFGLINNLLAVGIPLLVIRIVKPYIGYYTTFKVLVGMLTFPLFYYLQTRWLMNWLHESGWLIAVFYLLLTFSSLYIIHPYINRFQGLRSALRINRLKLKFPEKVIGLRESREQILAQIL